MRSILLCTIVFAASVASLRGQDTASVRTADGFQCPVGPNGSGEGYYIARSYVQNGHLGDDWNGVNGGDTDLGDPVYATAHGIVVFAKNYHVGWGNVVIIRHAYYEGLALKYLDSLYGHLDDFNVQEGQQVRRGQLIGHIGNNNGMYDAHLHFEMRKNLSIGMYRSSFPRDFTNYWVPNKFIATHPVCPRGDKTVAVPINTFPANAPPSYAADKVHTPVYTAHNAPPSHLPPVAGAKLLPPDPAPKVYAPTSPPSSGRSSVLARTAPVTPSPPTRPAPAKTAKNEANAPVVITDRNGAALNGPAVLTDAYEAGITPESSTPIRRSQRSFRVDRFEDLRGQGY